MSDLCYTCDERCSDCFGSIHLESVYDCITCIEGYIFHTGLCLPSCPDGYVADGDICTQNTDFATMLVAHFTDFAQFTSVYYDRIQQKSARLGSTEEYGDIDDPAVVRWAGLSFDGS